MRESTAPQGVDLMFLLHGDPVVEASFDDAAAIRSWLVVEAELARALADTGIIPRDTAEDIALACKIDHIDRSLLWDETRVVGYPILPLVRMICSKLPADTAGFV